MTARAPHDQRSKRFDRFAVAALAAIPLSILTSACGSTATPSRPNPAAIACDVAAAYAQIVIARADGKPVVFTTDDQPFSAPVVGGEWWKMEGELPQAGPAPPAALVKRLEDQGNRNAVSRCSSLRKLLDGRHIGYGLKAVDAVNSPDPSRLFTASIQTISLPVVSEDGRRAVLASSGLSGPLAGGGFLQLLERQDNGQWKVVAFSPLWVA